MMELKLVLYGKWERFRKKDCLNQIETIEERIGMAIESLGDTIP